MPTPWAADLPISASISARFSGPSWSASRSRAAASTGAGCFVARSHEARRPSRIAIASGQ